MGERGDGGGGGAAAGGTATLGDLETTVELEELILAAKTDPLTSLSALTPQDVSDVWWRISQLIAQNLVAKKGTRVPNLGTFTLTETKTEMGTQGTKVKHTPVFVLSPTFAARNDVQARTRFVEGTVPVTNLGLARIAALTGFDKDEIEACIREVVLALAERLDVPEGISLEFVGIGRLSLRRRKLKFKFYSEFEENPQVLEGRPPSRWGLSSRCQTAGIIGRGSRPQTAAGTIRAKTPMLLPTPSFEGRKSRSDGPLTKGRICWQSSFGGSEYLGIVDPTDEPAAVVPDGNSLPRRSNKPRELPKLTEEEEAEIISGAVRDVNLSIAKVERDPDVELADGFKKALTWDERSGNSIAELDMPLQETHKRDLALAAEAELVPPPPKREETMLLDPFRARPKKNQCTRCQGQGVCYVCFQLKKPLPDPDYHKRKAAEEKALDSKLVEYARKQDDKQRSIQKLLDDAKRDASRRTASYNLGVVVNRPPPEVDMVPRMDVLNKRPSTSHVDLRRDRQRNAEEVARQINANSTARKLREDQMRQIEATVLAVNKEKSEADAKAALELFRRGQLEYRSNLSAQEKARAEAAAREAAEEDAKNKATQPFKQTVLDEEYAKARRMHEREIARSNITMENERQRYEYEQRTAELAEGQALLDRAKKAYREELAEVAVETVQLTEAVRNDLVELTRRKRERELKSAQHRKAGAALTLLEQTDHIDRMRFHKPQPGLAFVGRATNLGGTTERFVKGTKLVA